MTMAKESRPSTALRYTHQVMPSSSSTGNDHRMESHGHTTTTTSSRIRPRPWRRSTNLGWTALAALCTLLWAPVTASPRRHLQTESRNIITYHTSPKLHWMIDLDQDDSMFHGNAIVQSPVRENLLYVTTHSGALVVISVEDGKTLQRVRPMPRSITRDGEIDEWSMYSTSSVSFGTTDDGQEFLVYSVVDVPPLNADTYGGPKTRVIAVSIPQHQQLWSSAGFPGIGNGSPLVYGGGGGLYIVMTHNSDLIRPDNSTLTLGHLTVLQAKKGHVVWTDSEWSRDGSPHGYGPPAISHSPDAGGNYIDGLDNTNDLVVWTSNQDEGRSNSGFTFAFQMPKDFRGAVSQLSTIVMKNVRWTAIARPVFNANGSKMFIGVTSSALRGWNGKTKFDETASWSSNLVVTEADPMAAVPTSPTLSRDEKRLFAPSAVTDFHCVDANTGKNLWQSKGTSTFLAEAKVSPDDKRVYAIQSIDGRIMSHNQETGELYWVASCDQFEEDCANSVRSHFELSQSGQYLFYGDVLGRMIALEVGIAKLNPNYPGDPGKSPGVLDGLPEGVTEWPGGKNKGKGGKSSALGGSIALIVVAVVIAGGSAMYILRVVSPRKRRESGRDLGGLDSCPIPPQVTMDSGFSDDIDGPDPYEDSLIKRLSPTNASQAVKRAAVDNGWERQQPPSDRVSLALGTSNRIAPIKEDFSYGASVLV